MSLPGYDEWKTRAPEDDDPRCEHCGAHEREIRSGWQPEQCTGKCGLLAWRDPDAEYGAMRERERDPLPPAGWDD